MLELRLPWLELMIAAPLVGALWLWRVADPVVARRRAIAAAAAALICALGAWRDFTALHAFEAHDRGNWTARWLGSEALVIDELSAPLLPLAALLYLLMIFSTLRTKVRRFPFAGTLISEALLLAMLSCRDPWGIIVLLALRAVPPWFELRHRRCSTRVFVAHMGLSFGLMVAGWVAVSTNPPQSPVWLLGIGLLVIAVAIRAGIAPLHGWVADLFENTSLGTSLLFILPMSGAYAAVRLLMPIAPEWALRVIAALSLLTAVYAAGMALVQREARRFFCYLFLSHSSLVLVGLEIASPLGFTGGLCVWLSVGMSLGGLGLTLRALESRAGRLSLATYHGFYDHMPTLATFFLITGLASIGFPGTIGFVGADLLVEGAVSISPAVGVLVVLVAALNGIAVMHAYFRLFTGRRHTASISLNARWPERVAVLTLTALILGGGLWPQPGASSRYHAAMELIERRDERMHLNTSSRQKVSRRTEHH